MSLSLAEYIRGVKAWTLQPDEIYAAYMQRAEQDSCNAFLTLTPQEGKIQKDRKSLPLAGAPLAIKDNIMTKWYRTTGASKMLEEYVAPYDATCYERLADQGMRMIGKTNMDEFAMWSSTENSAFWAVLNPHDHTRIPWGTSGGSAAAVAADMVIAALGTDTGGSSRFPAALCGVVWCKPTYGRISRYGIIPSASSFDQVGTLTKTVEDAVLLIDAMHWFDKHDATSVKRPDQEIADWYKVLQESNIQGMRIALPYECFGEWLDSDIEKMMREICDQLAAKWAHVGWVHIPILKVCIEAYYILVFAETATNFARFDGIRFGVQDETSKYETIFDYYKRERDAGLGPEVKRRIMLWNYVLSAGYYDAYYRKAQLVRQKLINELNKVYNEYDLILTPTSATVAWKLWGAKTDDPVQMYLMDIYTVVANLAGIPAISLPVGTIKTDGVDLPVGLQLMAKKRNEAALFRAGQVIENLPKISL